MIDRIVKNVDVLVGNEEDLQKGLGIPGPEVAAKSKLDPSAFFGMIGRVVKKHPHVKIVATTLREVHSTNRHSWSAVAWIDGQNYVAPTAELDVLDRVGGGDGFAAGFFYGLLTRRVAGGGGEAGVGARRAADDFSGRHHDGDPRTGTQLRQRRLSPHPALVANGSSRPAFVGGWPALLTLVNSRNGSRIFRCPACGSPGSLSGNETLPVRTSRARRGERARIPATVSANFFAKST